MKENYGLSGSWQSCYKYRSSSREQEFESKHTVALQQNGREMIITSLPDSTGSSPEIRLISDDKIFTGTWREQTSAIGHYKGRTFHGALQLILSDDAKQLAGKWLGFNSQQTTVKSGVWTLRKI